MLGPSDSETSSHVRLKDKGAQSENNVKVEILVDERTLGNFRAPGSYNNS